MKRQTIWRVFIALMLLGCSGAMVSCSKDLPDETFVPSKYALIDLHLHLDGSLTVDVAIYMASVDGVTLPSSRSEIEKLLVCPDDCESLNDYIKCFDLPVSIMQSKETIAYSVRSLVKRLDAQGLIYAEIRYAPQQQLQKGLTQDEVVAASIEGLRQGMAKKYLGQGVCALDIAGAEALFPTSKYRDLFAYAREQGVPFTIHAGEADGVESMRLAIEYGATRIGHGVRSWNDADMKALVKEKDVCLTLCPSSNLQTKALEGVTKMTQFPLQYFLKAGVPVCINTDNMSVSNTTVAKELGRLHDAGVMSAADAKTMVRTAIKHAYLSDTEKAELLKKAEEKMK